MTNCLICDSHQILHERRTSTLTVSRCHTCGHRTATHSSDPSLRSIDYHKQYESSGFLSALEITRRRQAAMMAFQIQQFLPEPGAILDFGCGHGWFLEACAAAGLSPLMGVDTSALAISELAKKGIQGMTINIGDATPSAILRDIRAQLSIQPQVITLLDVCEHFEGTRLMEWLRCMKDTFSHSLKLLILKVPSSNGLLFRGATNFSRLGIHGPLHQLYQVGTYPPHYHYFSDHSIRLLAKKLQFVSIAELGDPDLDPEGFSDRVRILKHLPRHVATFLGSILCSTARRMSATDTRILFLRPD